MFSDILWLRAQPYVSLSDRKLALMNAIKVVFPTMASHCVWQKKIFHQKCKANFEIQEVCTFFVYLEWGDVFA